jgi:predicted nuclease of predicted toxin-antitoxin system
MARFLIDANLPRLVSVWSGDDFVWMHDIDPRWSDTAIWNFAAANTLTIITKDADFSHRVSASSRGPVVVHIRLGNMRFRELDAFFASVWPEILLALPQARMVQVYRDRLEVIR